MNEIMKARAAANVASNVERHLAIAEFLQEFIPPVTNYSSAWTMTYPEFDEDITSQITEREWYDALLADLVRIYREFKARYPERIARKVDTSYDRGFSFELPGGHRISLLISRKNACEIKPVLDENGNPVMETVTEHQTVEVTVTRPKVTQECRPLLSFADDKTDDKEAATEEASV